MWWERVGGSGGGTVYIDNIHVLPLDTSPDTTAPSAPVLDSISKNGDILLRPNWSNTNSPGDGVVGYNVYRWLDGESASTKIKMNTGLVDNPYIRFDDHTVARGVSYRYHITALDAAGNESSPSNDKSKSLTDTIAPGVPAPLWAVSCSSTIDLGWFGLTDWDIAGYDVYRRVAGDPAFTMLTTVADPVGAIFFNDPTAVGGMNYEYYVEAFDELGNISASTAVTSVQSTTGVTHVDAWKCAFNGVNGWQSSTPSVSASQLDFDEDGIATVWEYLQGTNPAFKDRSPANLPQNHGEQIGGKLYHVMSYDRQEFLPPGLVVKLQGSNDLSLWTDFVIEGAAPAPGITISTGAPVDGQRTISIRQNIPVGGPGSFQFLRIAVEEN